MADTDLYGSTSVEERTADIASKDSELNQMAKTEAAKVMNRRGLLNSSMTVGAAQDAVLKSAVPIASQDASQAFQGSESALQRASTEWMQTKDIQNQQQMQTQELQNDAWMQQQDIATQKWTAQLDYNLQTTLKEWDLSSSDRNAAAQLLTNLQTIYQDQYDSIMDNEYLDAETRTVYLEAAKAQQDSYMSLLEQMFGVDLAW